MFTFRDKEFNYFCFIPLSLGAVNFDNSNLAHKAKVSVIYSTQRLQVITRTVMFISSQFFVDLSFSYLRDFEVLKCNCNM